MKRQTIQVLWTFSVSGCLLSVTSSHMLQNTVGHPISTFWFPSPVSTHNYDACIILLQKLTSQVMLNHHRYKHISSTLFQGDNFESVATNNPTDLTQGQTCSLSETGVHRSFWHIAVVYYMMGRLMAHWLYDAFCHMKSAVWTLPRGWGRTTSSTSPWLKKVRATWEPRLSYPIVCLYKMLSN